MDGRVQTRQKLGRPVAGGGQAPRPHVVAKGQPAVPFKYFIGHEVCSAGHLPYDAALGIQEH